jgi:hypothetical protein
MSHAHGVSSLGGRVCAIINRLSQTPSSHASDQGHSMFKLVLSQDFPGGLHQCSLLRPREQIAFPQSPAQDKSNASFRKPENTSSERLQVKILAVLLRERSQDWSVDSCSKDRTDFTHLTLQTNSGHPSCTCQCYWHALSTSYAINLLPRFPRAAKSCHRLSPHCAGLFRSRCRCYSRHLQIHSEVISEATPYHMRQRLVTTGCRINRQVYIHPGTKTALTSLVCICR